MNEQALMTVHDLATFLNVKQSWIYGHMREIPHYKIGSLVRFDPAQLQRWLIDGEKDGGTNSSNQQGHAPLRTDRVVMRFPSSAVN
jgi:excisionase family DNA binding protein